MAQEALPDGTRYPPAPDSTHGEDRLPRPRHLGARPRRTPQRPAPPTRATRNQGNTGFRFPAGLGKYLLVVALIAVPVTIGVTRDGDDSAGSGASSGGARVQRAEVSDLPEVVPAQARENLNYCSVSETSVGEDFERYPAINCMMQDEYAEQISRVQTLADEAAVAALRDDRWSPKVEIEITPRDGHELQVLDHSLGGEENFYVIDIAADGSAAATYFLAVPEAKIADPLVALGMAAGPGAGDGATL